MATPYNQVSRTAARALEEFSDEFRNALVLEDVNSWAIENGLDRQTDALKTTFPLPLDAAGYKEFKGDIKYRSLFSRSMSMKGKEWSDGVKERAAVIEAPDFIDWAGAPKRMALEWKRLPNEILATLLATSTFAGPLLDLYRDDETGTASTRRLFATDHPFNVMQPDLGDFDNTIQCTVAEIQSGAAFDAIEDRFAEVMGPNGKPMGLSFLEGGRALVSRGRAQLFKKTLEFDTLIRTVSNAGVIGATSNVVSAVPQNNIYKGLSYTACDELTSNTYWYALANKAVSGGLHPWIVQRQSAPQEFLHDKSSEMYKNSLHVAIAYIGQMNAAAALPHGIIRVEITG